MSTRFPAVVSATRGALARVRAIVLEKTGDDAVDRVLARLVDSLRPLLANPRLDSTIVQDQTFAAGIPLAIPHRLGRNYSGWAVHRVRSNGSTFYEQANAIATLDASQVTLIASANCTADVEVW